MMGSEVLGLYFYENDALPFTTNITQQNAYTPTQRYSGELLEVFNYVKFYQNVLYT